MNTMLKKSPKLVQSITLLLMKRLSNTLDMLDADEDIIVKKLPVISDLLSLMAQYEQDIDYVLFCKKAMGITNVDQKDMDTILQQLIELGAIEIVKDDHQNGSGWSIKNIDSKSLP